MSLSLWMVLGFAVWTMLVLIAGIGVHRCMLILRGAAEFNSFPGDVPHGSVPYRRAMRAHANCIENLPVFAAIVLAGALTKLNTPATDALAVTTLSARLVQSTIHMVLPERSGTVAARFSFYLIQLICMLTMAAQLALAALRSSTLV